MNKKEKKHKGQGRDSGASHDHGKDSGQDNARGKEQSKFVQLISSKFDQVLDAISPCQADEEAAARNLHWKYANTLLVTLIIINVALVIVQAIFQTIMSYSNIVDMFSSAWKAINLYTILYFVLMLLTAASIVALYSFDKRAQYHRARILTRFIVVLLVIGFLVNVIVNGMNPTAFIYLFQFVCVIAYQLYNDPLLARPVHFANPFSRDKKLNQGQGSERDKLDQGLGSGRDKLDQEQDSERGKNLDQNLDPDPHRKSYIPLDFFNVFWIFIIGSAVGLAIEMVFCLFVNNVWESRAGLVFLPLSPIYGTGAMLLTFALNRIWNKNAIFIYIVSAIVGAAVEFAVSWYMETAFGVLAWDYSNEFLNLDGRTDFAHALAWGLLGLLWIRIILPALMQVMRVIPLRWRAFVTTVALVIFLIDGITTLVALDCWSEREAGIPPQTQEQIFFAEHFDDDFMQERFSNMGISEEGAARAQNEKSVAEQKILYDIEQG